MLWMPTTNIDLQTTSRWTQFQNLCTGQYPESSKQHSIKNKNIVIVLHRKIYTCKYEMDYSIIKDAYNE